MESRRTLGRWLIVNVVQYVAFKENILTVAVRENIYILNKLETLLFELTRHAYFRDFGYHVHHERFGEMK